MNTIIDFHSHYMPPAVAQNTMFFKVNWSDPDRQLQVMDQLGIAKSVLLYPTSDAHVNMGGWANVCAAYNQGVADVVSQYPDRFVGGGILPVDDPSKIQDELKRIKDLNLSVLSLASSYEGRYLDDELFYPIYEFAKDNSMPIHVHAQIMNPIGEERLKDPLLSPALEYVFDVSVCIGKMMMNETLLKFSDVDFIFAHYGGVLPLVKERFDNTYQMLRKRNFVKDLKKNPSEYFKNLYFDTSGSKSVASLLAALELVDASHILYGSDFPANQGMRDSIDFLGAEELKRVPKSSILHDNAGVLLGQKSSVA